MNHNPPKISIIIPAYNVGEYLEATLRSAVVQTLHDIEIIPVNDGSTDESPAIIDRFAREDCRIQPIHKTNGGYGSAVNAGIRSARGEYVFILEGDDCIIDDILYILWHSALEYDLDICRYNSYYEIREHFAPRLKYTYYPGVHEILSPEQLAEFFACGHPGICQAIYRRQFLLDKQIYVSEESKAYLDIDFVVLVYTKAARIKILQTVGYLYRRDVPTQSVGSPGNALCSVEAVERVLQLLPECGCLAVVRWGIIGYVVAHLIHNKRGLALRFPESPVCTVIDFTIAAIAHLEPSILVRGDLHDEPETSFWGNRKTAVVPTPPDLAAMPQLDETITGGACNLALLLALFHMRIALHFTEAALDRNSPVIFEDIFRVATEFLLPGNRFVTMLLHKYILTRYDYFNFLTTHTWAFTGILAYMFESGQPGAVGHFISARAISPSISWHMREYPRAAVKIQEQYGTYDTCDSAFLWRRMRENEKDFLAYLSGKSIAVVGNSPCEVGKGKGAEIDAHDVVIRFNNYLLEEEMLRDYGSKESVWCISPIFASIRFRTDFAKYEFILSAEVCLRSMPAVKKRYMQWWLEAGISFFLMDARHSLRYKTNMHIVSLGLYVLEYLLNYRDCLGHVDMYGFAFVDAAGEGGRHYFRGDPITNSALLFHNWEKEALYFQEIRKGFL
jgi:hypothetical protein